MRRLCEMKFLWRYTWKNTRRLLSVLQKERSKIREKKPAHGQKEGADGYATDEDEYFGLYM